MSLATKEQSLSAFSDPCVFFPLAADPAELENRFGETAQLRKNSRQGFTTKNLALHQGGAWTNSGTALGIEPVLRREGIRSRCTGKERDTESGNDYFGARYYGSSLGRFMTPDWSSTPNAIPFADLHDPQTLNQYGYVRNNPLLHADVDGHGFWDTLKNCFVYSHCVSDEKITQMAQQDRDWLKQNCLSCWGKSGADFDKMSNWQVIQYYDSEKEAEANGRVAYGTPPNVGTVPAGPMQTQWGWTGQQSYGDAVKKLNVPNTAEGTVNITESELGGKVPTREEALRMIQDSGGKMIRDVETHGPESVSTHQYPHINYETASGIKGTIKVQQ